MNRRSFLSLLGLGALGAAASTLELDPERLLWVPGRKTFFIPSGVESVYSNGSAGDQLLIVSGGRGNQFLTSDLITQEALKILEQNLQFASMAQRRYNIARSAAAETVEQQRRDLAFVAGEQWPTVDVRLPARYRTC